MMEYVFYYNCQYYSIFAVTPWKADQLLDELVGRGAAASAVITSVKAAA